MVRENDGRCLTTDFVGEMALSQKAEDANGRTQQTEYVRKRNGD